MARVSVLEDGPSPVVLIDFSHQDPAGVIETVAEATAAIRSRPPKSVDTITRTDGATFNSEVIGALKDFARGNEPHVRRAAVVGLSGMQRIVLSAVSHFTGRPFLLAATVDEARRMLAADA